MSQEHPEAFAKAAAEGAAGFDRKRLRSMISDVQEHAESAREHGEPVDWDLLFQAIRVLEREVA